MSRETRARRSELVQQNPPNRALRVAAFSAREPRCDCARLHTEACSTGRGALQDMVGGTDQHPMVPPGQSRRPRGPEPAPIPVERGSQAQRQRDGTTHSAPSAVPGQTEARPPEPSPLTCEGLLLRQHTPDHDGEAGRETGQVSLCGPEARPRGNGPEGKRSRAFKSEAVGETRGRRDTQTFSTGS